MGKIRGSLLVVFFPSTVSPRIGVISLPAYVVGIQICGSPVLIDIALPKPIVEPPPIEITESAFADIAKASAFSVIAIGVCIVASEKIPTILPSRRCFSCEACCTCCGVERSSGADRLRRASSDDNLESVPEPKMTRAGDALYSNEFIVSLKQ
mgnify:CR=1 FL=1